MPLLIRYQIINWLRLHQSAFHIFGSAFRLSSLYETVFNSNLGRKLLSSITWYPWTSMQPSMEIWLVGEMDDCWTMGEPPAWWPILHLQGYQPQQWISKPPPVACNPPPSKAPSVPSVTRKGKPPSSRGSVSDSFSRRHNIASGGGGSTSTRDDESLSSSVSVPSYIAPAKSRKTKPQLPSTSGLNRTPPGKGRRGGSHARALQPQQIWEGIQGFQR